MSIRSSYQTIIIQLKQGTMKEPTKLHGIRLQHFKFIETEGFH